MKDRTALKARYLQDRLPIRLGGLAANLARVKSFSNHPDHCDVVKNIVDESKFFIEWTAMDASIEQQVTLIELQVQLARWQNSWDNLWANSTQRAAVAEQANLWSKRILALSGFMVA